MRKLILILLIAVPVLAQDIGVNFEQDPSSGTCASCVPIGTTNRVRCAANTPDPAYWWGQRGCVAHNTPTGPGGCTFSGRECFGYPGTYPGAASGDDGREAVSPVKFAEDSYTLAVLLGDDAMSAFMDDVAIQTLGLPADERAFVVARLYSARLADAQLSLRGIPRELRLVIPRPVASVTLDELQDQ